MTANIETHLVEANGLTFEVDTCGDGERFALLLHGFPECAHAWRHQLPLLARLGYTAWAPNLRGYGRTSRPARVADYAMPLLLDDVEGLFQAAGAERPLLVGHDWGGAIAWSFAIQGRRELDRLAVMNLPHPKLFAKGVRRWPQIARSWYMFFFQLPWLPEALMRAGNARIVARAILANAADPASFPREAVELYRARAAEPGALTAMLNYYRALFRYRGFDVLRGRMREPLATPTLLLWGEADKALGKELTYGTEDLVADLTLRYLPRAGHWVQQEAPEVVNTMLEAWLEGAPVPEAGEVGAQPEGAA